MPIDQDRSVNHPQGEPRSHGPTVPRPRLDAGPLLMLRRVARGLLVAHGLGWLVAGGVAGVVLVALVDYVLRTPEWVRCCVLLAGIGVVGWVVVKRLWPAVRFRPSLEELALRVERSAQGRQLRLAGTLASAVSLSDRTEADVTERALAAPVIRAAAASLRSLSVLRALRLRAPLLAVAIGTGAVLGAMTFTAAYPAVAWIGVRRVLVPFSGAEWPRRTQVADVTETQVHPLGSALVLRAGLVRSPVPSASTSVEARFRLFDAQGRPGPLRRLAMTSQERPVTAVVPDERGTPVQVPAVLFERLIEPGALVASGDATTPAGDDTRLEYWFTTDDDQTAPRTVRLVTPPSVTGATARVVLPAYLPGRSTEGEYRDLGPGVDERAIVGGILPGSQVVVDLRFSKPVPWRAGGAWAGGQWPLGREAEQLRVSTDPARRLTMTPLPPQRAAGEGLTDGWRLTWNARESLRLPVVLVDEYGVTGTGESVFRFEIRADRPPEAVVVVPEQDVDVLATAVIEVRAEARDDVALSRLALEHRLARRSPGSVGAAPEPVTEAVELAAALPPDADRPVQALTTSARLDLSTLGLVPGDEVWITAVATDAYELDGRRHEPVRSPVRRVRIISPDQLNELLWSELAGLRRTAIQTSERQAAAAQALSRDPQPPSEARMRSAAREQAGVTDAVQRMEQSLQRAVERARQAAGADRSTPGSTPPSGTERGQRPGDPRDQGDRPGEAPPRDTPRAAEVPLDREVEEAIRTAQDLLQVARESSSGASRALQESQQARGQDDAARAAEAQRQAERDQRAAQEALDRLAEALDRGQDAFTQRRALERLVRDQEELRRQTRDLDAQTSGRELDELTPEQRQAVEQLARRQEQLSQRAQDTINQMQQRADQLRSGDPQTAEALQRAAQRGQRQAVSEQMQQAARQIRRNQQQTASQQQERAAQAVQQMLDELREAARDRDATLRRILASLIETIDALIAQQEQELQTLLAAVTPAQLIGLDQGMIRLTTATLAAVDQARAAGREARGVAEALERASAAQEQAVSALRARPVEAVQAAARETESLAQLRRAREEASRAQQQAEQRDRQRRRQELRQEYRQLMERQAELRAQTDAARAMPADRRQRAVARQIGADQEALRQAASDLLEKTEGLAESELFPIAHRRIDTASMDATNLLSDGQVSTLVTARQVVVLRTLEALIDALDESDRRDQPFRENDQGNQDGSGGGGGQGQDRLIAILAELRLLRQLQVDALRSTREAAEGHDQPVVRALIRDAAELQDQLAAKAERLLEMLQQMQQQGPAGGAGGPGGPVMPRLPDEPGGR